MSRYAVQIESCDIEKAKALVYATNYDFDPPLSQSIDIDKMAEKWSKYAKFLTLHDNYKELVALVVFYENKEERFLYIPHFVVRAPFRHKGVGHACIKYLLETTKSEGFEMFRLEVLKTNANAIQFYHKEGFGLKEERENTYLLEKEINMNIR